jgi:rubrerythrin
MGTLKLGVQMAGLPGGDRTILLAFVSNEWQSREKYARYASRSYSPELLTLLKRHAADEARHYEWARAALEELGCGTETAVGRAVQAFAQFHGASADILEAVGRSTMEAAARAFKAA